MKFAILFLLIVGACGEKSSTSSGAGNLEKLPNTPLGTTDKRELKIAAEVQSYFSSMNEYIIVYLKGTSITNLIVEYTDDDTKPHEGPARGYCDRSGSTPRITLYRPDWVGPNQVSDPMRTAAFYHLVGHCVFGKDHNNKTGTVNYPGVTYTPPVSFMHSHFGYHLYPPNTFDSSDIVDLQREFFNYYGPL